MTYNYSEDDVNEAIEMAEMTRADEIADLRARIAELEAALPSKREAKWFKEIKGFIWNRNADWRELEFGIKVLEPMFDRAARALKDADT